jgi:MFS family permease
MLGHFGWRAVFLIYLLPLPMAFLIWKATRSLSLTSAEVDERGDVAGHIAFPWRRMSGICAVTLFGSILFYVLQLQGGLALASVGVTNSVVIGILGAVGAVGAISGTLLFRFAKHWQTAFLLALSFLLIGAGLLGMGLSRNPGLMTASHFLGQIGCGLLLPTLITWSIRGLAFEVRGRGVGLAQGVYASGQFVSGIIFSILMSKTGDVRGAFFILSSISVMAVPVCMSLPIRARQGLTRPDAL